ATWSRSLRTMTSIMSPGGGSRNSVTDAGRFNCSTTVFEKTAVMSRNVTSTVKMSIIGTSISSAGLRILRAIFLVSKERRMADASALGPGRRRLALGDGVQELHG